MPVKRGKKANKLKPITKAKSYIRLSNAYASLPQFAADPPPQPQSAAKLNNNNPVHVSWFKLKAQRRYAARVAKRAQQQAVEELLDHHITWAEDERTTLAKQSNNNPHKQTIEANHTIHRSKPVSILQNGKNKGYALQTTITRAFKGLFTSKPTVHFANQAEVRTIPTNAATPMITYDSGADGHYISESDRHRANLPILRKSSKRVGVANGGTSTAEHVTQLPFDNLSATAKSADTFNDFPQSLMSVGKTADDGTISIFTRDGVTVHKEEDVLITCRGEPILIGVRDEFGRYRIPLMQQRGQWTPRIPSKKAKQVLRQANSVYDLPSTEQAIKWMHAVCG